MTSDAQNRGHVTCVWATTNLHAHMTPEASCGPAAGRLKVTMASAQLRILITHNPRPTHPTLTSWEVQQVH